MAESITARQDVRLRAQITRRTPLHYAGGADSGLDRPPHVRAASSLVQFEEHLAVIQDDANFLALVDADRDTVVSLPLPATAGGARVFDKGRENLHEKLDLEACTVVPGSAGERLVAFGSGSSESREWILDVGRGDGDELDVELRQASAFYTHLRRHSEFSGSGLNIEGAVFISPNTLRLFQRGNFPPTDSAPAVDATADIDWPAMDAHLRDPGRVPPPELRHVTRYELGELDGVRLTFSDAELCPDGAVLFSASAEGGHRIAGSVLGVIDGEGARWSLLHDEDGSVFNGKIEGLALSGGDRGQVYFVIDDDQADKPSEMFVARLDGPWWGPGQG